MYGTLSAHLSWLANCRMYILFQALALTVCIVQCLEITKMMLPKSVH